MRVIRCCLRLTLMLAVSAFSQGHAQTTAFPGVGIADTAFGLPLGSSRDVLLIIAADGKTQSQRVSHCDDSVLEKPVIASIVTARFTPALRKGQPVNLKASLHLVYQGLADPHQE